MRSPFTSISAKIESWTARKELTALLTVLDPKAADLILDVGAGYGWVADQVGHICSEVVALEPDKERAGQMRRSHPSLAVISGIGEVLPIRTSIFDKVYLRRSFHHLTDQEKTLKEIDRATKPSGSLLIQELSPDRRGNVISSAERLLRGVHVDFLSSADLKTKLERQGFLVKVTKPAVAGYFLVAVKKSET